MIYFFAPRTEHTDFVGRSGSPHDRSAWGQTARQPGEQDLLSRLARIITGCSPELVCIYTCAAIPVAMASAIAWYQIGGFFWPPLITICCICFYCMAMIYVADLYDAAEQTASLQAENTDLLLDKEYLLRERGQLLREIELWAAGGDTAAGFHTERAKPAATVIPFSKTDGGVA